MTPPKLLKIDDKVIINFPSSKYNTKIAKIVDSGDELLFDDEKYPEGYYMYVLRLEQPVYSEALNRDIRTISGYSYSISPLHSSDYVISTQSGGGKTRNRKSKKNTRKHKKTNKIRK